MDEEKTVEWTIEIDDDLYVAASLVCKSWGTTIEEMTEAFIRFCVMPENLPLVDAFIKETEDRQGINWKVFQAVLEIAYRQRS